MKGNRKHLEVAGALMEKALTANPEGHPPSFKGTVAESFNNQLHIEKHGFVWWIVDEQGQRVRGPYGDKNIAQRSLDDHR